MQRKDWATRVDGLVVFRGLLQSEPLASLRAALAADAAGLTGAVAAFESALFTQGTNWTEVLLDAVLENENLCLRTAAGGDAGPVLEKALENELEFLQQLGTAGLDDLCPEAPAFLPRWEVSPDANYAAAYQARRAAVGQKGYGMFARHHVFTIEDGRLVPVRYPDPQRLSELPGYEREREKVIANTRALLESKPTNNVLLYGDAGTGKSSTVKAIANEFAPDGLRLIEVKKNQLYQIPALMDELAKNPHRRPELLGQRRQLCRAESHSGGQRGRPQPQRGRVRHQQPPPSGQGKHERPQWRRPACRRYPPGADEPGGAVRPDGDLPAAG